MESRYKSYFVKDFIKFIVTGRLYRSNKRFSIIYSDYWIANSINLWNSSVWGIPS